MNDQERTMVQIKLPVSIRVICPILDVLAALAKEDGRAVFMRQVGEYLELYSIPAPADRALSEPSPP